ncbi:MAG: hypothetical protein K9J21_06900 [Bacteroidales bacterium]|nr:hypothetical protein [Bacteroidales bacterium]
MVQQSDIYKAISEKLETEFGTPPDTLADLEADVNAGNEVAEWRIWTKIFTFASYVLEQVFQKHKTDVNQLVNKPKLYGIRWIQEMALSYQHGNSLSYVDGAYIYVNPIDTLLAHCSVSLNGKTVHIKAAKSGPTKLTTSEKDGLKAYLEEILYPGTHFAIISEDADFIRYQINIYRDPTVIDDSGAKITEPSTKPVEAAIDEFVTNIPFDAKFNRNAFIDKIQGVEGVIDVTIDMLEHKYGNLNYTLIDREVISMAGYYTIDAGNINYLIP